MIEDASEILAKIIYKNAKGFSILPGDQPRADDGDAPVLRQFFRGE